MQFVGAKDIREGMCVAQDVADPSGRILISRGQRIADHHIIRLRKFAIQSIFIDEKAGEQAEAPRGSELRDQCVKVLSQSFTNVGKQFSDKKLTIDADSLRAAADNLVDSLTRCRNPLVTLSAIDDESDALMQHSVNVAVLSTVMAIDMKVPASMVKDLAAAAMFHDIGMLFVPGEPLQKQGPLTAPELIATRRHPQLGFEHLIRADAVSAIAANIVRSHHEAMDGSGYPLGLQADKLSALTRIIAVAEVYDALTSPRYGLPAAMPDAAISFIVSNVNRLFAREAALALCQRVALYPKGCAVQLNSGEYGLVAGILPTAPTRPVVLVHIDNRGRQLKSPVVVDLTADAGRNVARSAATLSALIASANQPHVSVQVDPRLAQLG